MTLTQEKKRVHDVTSGGSIPSAQIKIAITVHIEIKPVIPVVGEVVVYPKYLPSSFVQAVMVEVPHLGSKNSF